MSGAREQPKVEALRNEWRARFARALGELAPSHDELEEAFGAPTAAEREASEAEARELARLEEEARNRPVPPDRKPFWRRRPR